MARILAKHTWLVAVLTLTAFPLYCSAQEKPLSIPLVPAADWRQVDSHPLPLSTISKYGGDPAVEQEYGVKALELRTYQLGKTPMQVLVEPGLDAISAYGLLTFYQTPDMTPEKGLPLTVGDTNQTLMARGNNFIRFLHGKDFPTSRNDFQALIVFIGGSRLPKSTIMSLPSPMPSQGLVPGSEKYILGLEAAKRALPSFRSDLIGFEQGAQLQLGQYKTAQGASTLMSISYPTPQIARVRFGALTNFLGLNRDQGEGSIYGRRHTSYVFLVLNAGNQRNASALMDEFDVTASVSWDQPSSPERSFTLQVVHMILAILLLTAYLIGACVVAGVLFFLSRRLAAKFFPESSWGHPDEDQFIRLNLGS
jgi:hypothetical protein